MAGSPTLVPESRFGSTLRRDAWSLAILFAAHRPTASLVALLSSLTDSRWPFGLSRHMLLLPQSVLPGVSPRSPCLCGW